MVGRAKEAQPQNIKTEYRIMRFSNFKYWCTGMNEKIVMKLAWLVPRRIAFWCFIRVYAHATSEDRGVSAGIEFKKVADAWEGRTQ